VESKLTAGQVRLALAGDFGDQAVRLRGEETGVPPDLQAPVGGRSVPNLPGSLTPLRVCPEPPHRTLALIPQPLSELPPRHDVFLSDPPEGRRRSSGRERVQGLAGTTGQQAKPILWHGDLVGHEVDHPCQPLEIPPPSAIVMRTGVLHMLVHAEPDETGGPGRGVDRRFQQRRVRSRVVFRGRIRG
jgi:hypothetical protein